MLSAKSKSILMFFPWNGTHPQDAFAGVRGEAAARHWDFQSAETVRADDGTALAGACALAADPATEKTAMPGTAAPVVYFTHDISPEGQGFEARDTSGGTTRSVWRQR